MANILIIDDESDVRDSIAKVLTREGHAVLTAEGARSGLEILAENQVDVLVTDIIMPGMDGVQAIRQVKTVKPEVKIVAISGGGNFGLDSYQPNAITTTAFLQAAADAGADRILTKPFERAELIDCVASVLGSP